VRGRGAAFPKGRERPKGIVVGITSFEAMARERKEEKEEVYCMGSMMLFAGPGKRVMYKYARRVEADGVVLCLMLSSKR